MRVPLIAAAILAMAWAFMPPAEAAAPSTTPVQAAAQPADYFSYPLPTWEPHCLGFGSQWRLCDGTVLRRCAATGAIWLHTGYDVKTGIQPVMAAANGTIIGYTVDPMFKGGMLISHVTAQGVVITQYWHVWPRPGFGVGKVVSRGQVFADIADMGSRTHFHFAVYIGNFTANSWRGALPPKACDGFPAFPNRFVNPNDFMQSHLQPAPQPVCHRTAAP